MQYIGISVNFFSVLKHSPEWEWLRQAWRGKTRFLVETNRDSVELFQCFEVTYLKGVANTDMEG